MNTKKYLFAGIFALSVALGANAQNEAFRESLKPIAAALEAAPNDVNASKDLVKAYKKQYKKDPAAIVALGYSYFGVKNYTSAIECADLALKINNKFGDAYVLKGDVSSMQDDGGAAAGWYQQAMHQDPKNPNGYLGYANVYRKRDPQGAEDAINQLRQTNPDFPVDAELGHLMFNADNMDKAYEYYSKANMDKLNEGRLAEYALVAGSVNQKAKALDIAKFGLSKFPSSKAFLRLAIINAVGTEKYDEAVNYAKKLIAEEGENNSGDLIYYGQALSGLGQYEEAIAKFNKAIEVDSKNIMPYQHISETYAKMGDEDKAIEYSKKYLDLNPNAKLSEYNKLAAIYMAKVKKGDGVEDNYAKAMQVYDDVIAKYPQVKGWALTQKANETFKAEMDDQALELYKNVINEISNSTDSDDRGYLTTAYRNVGYILWSSKGDPAAAREYFEKTLELDPENSLAKKYFEAEAAANAEATEEVATEEAAE
ncbi:MAG: tetratricopeptide repeat protein [Prevotella sp.]|nr:tetratricopeptide repeat protein [Prevotella sp.]MBQ6210410.1 tetratricopeptide repeat protein [Prevotella sp.]